MIQNKCLIVSMPRNLTEKLRAKYFGRRICPELIEEVQKELCEVSDAHVYLMNTLSLMKRSCAEDVPGYTSPNIQPSDVDVNGKVRAYIATEKDSKIPHLHTNDVTELSDLLTVRTWIDSIIHWFTKK